MAGRPWIEASALLGAHGHAVAPLTKINPLARSLRMTEFAPFAFATRLDTVHKPRVFGSARSLAAYIERQRCGQAIELVDVEDIELEGRAGLYTGVQLFTLLIDGGRDRCIGWAWLNGQGSDRLEPALRAVRQDKGRREAA